MSTKWTRNNAGRKCVAIILEFGLSSKGKKIFVWKSRHGTLPGGVNLSYRHVKV